MEYTEKIQNYLKIAHIYTDLKLTDQKILEKAEEYQEREKWVRVEDGFVTYLRHELNVPIFIPDALEAILKLGRKLSDLEEEALRFQKKVRESGEKGITVTIEGI